MIGANGRQDQPMPVNQGSNLTSECPFAAGGLVSMDIHGDAP